MTSIQVVAKFLFATQSIGSSLEGVSSILNYYKGRIVPEKDILDFAFEWIRAQKIRLEYKKYLSLKQFSDYDLAVDDCIFRFFLEYDKYIRKILKEDLKEYEISALYEIFFSPEEKQIEDVNFFLEKHEPKVPTIFFNSGKETVKFSTNIITIRSGLSGIIYEDNKKFFPSLVKEIKVILKKIIQNQSKKKNHFVEDSAPFSGALLERMIKSYCLSKNKLEPREIEKAVSQFLSSYFKFGNFYKCGEFRKPLETCITEEIFSGLSESLKKEFSKVTIKSRMTIGMKDAYEKYIEKKLDGLAWINDLKPILTELLINFIDSLTL